MARRAGPTARRSARAPDGRRARHRERERLSTAHATRPAHGQVTGRPRPSATDPSTRRLERRRSGVLSAGEKKEKTARDGMGWDDGTGGRPEVGRSLCRHGTSATGTTGGREKEPAKATTLVCVTSSHSVGGCVDGRTGGRPSERPKTRVRSASAGTHGRAGRSRGGRRGRETLDRRDDEAVTEFENEGGENTVGGSTESQPLHTRRDAAADEHGSHRRETS